MNWETWKRRINKLLPYLLIIAIIFLAEIETFRNILLSFIIFIILFLAYKLYINWDMFMQGIRLIESMIWGVSLDKENKDILKNTKVVFKWKKKK